MRLSELVKWQWEGYATFHQSRTNLLIHIIFVPLFIISFIALLLAVLSLDLPQACSALVSMLIAFGLQGFGHQQETNPALPFTSFKNAITRILLEQLYTFPKFVLQGKWYKALRASAS